MAMYSVIECSEGAVLRFEGETSAGGGIGDGVRRMRSEIL